MFKYVNAVVSLLVVFWACGCGGEDPVPAPDVSIVICAEPAIDDINVQCNGDTDGGDVDQENGTDNNGAGSGGGAAASSSGAGGGSAAIVDCEKVSPATLCNSAGHTCTPDGRCAPFEWGMACDIGECPPFPCKQAMCVSGACMQWNEANGASCLGDNGQCSDGECKIDGPKP